MPRPLSLDLRKRIIEAKLREDTELQIASEKSVSKSVVPKLWALYRQTGSYASRPNLNGRKPRTPVAHAILLRNLFGVPTFAHEVERFLFAPQHLHEKFIPLLMILQVIGKKEMIDFDF